MDAVLVITKLDLVALAEEAPEEVLRDYAGPRVRRRGARRS
jgi:hypothetical protein